MNLRMHTRSLAPEHTQTESNLSGLSQFSITGPRLPLLQATPAQTQPVSTTAVQVPPPQQTLQPGPSTAPVRSRPYAEDTQHIGTLHAS